MSLRDRLAKIEALGEFDAWAGIADEIVDEAVAVVADWLRDEAAVQWKRAETHDDPRSREMASIRAMHLTDRAIELDESLTNTTDAPKEGHRG
jgi:hypothetical protein